MNNLLPYILKRLGYTALTIPAGSYPDQTEDVQAVGYATHVIARCDLPAETICYGSPARPIRPRPAAEVSGA